MKTPTRGRLRSRAAAIIGAAILALATGVGPASAATTTGVDAGWQSFITSGGLGGTSIAGPYVFTSTGFAKLTVTDAFCHGDEFTVSDNDVALGDTSAVPSEFPACPFRLFFPAIARADAAIADPTFSQGVFFLAPGSHAIDFRIKEIWGPTSTGTGAFFRVDGVSIAKRDCKDDGWRAFGTLFKNQGSCVSATV